MFEGLLKNPGTAPTSSDVSQIVSITPDSLCPRTTYQAIGSGGPGSGNIDLTATGTTGFPVAYARRIVVGTATSTALLFVKRAGDAGYTAYAVQPGQVLDGIFTSIGGTTTGTTGVTYVNAEC